MLTAETLLADLLALVNEDFSTSELETERACAIAAILTRVSKRGGLKWVGYGFLKF